MSSPTQMSSHSEQPEAVSPRALQPSSPTSPITPNSLTASQPRLPSLRTVSDPPVLATMTSSSTPLGSLNAARRPVPGPTSSLAGARGGGLPEDMQAKMKAFHLSRQGAPPAAGARNPGFTPAGVPTLPTKNVDSNPAISVPNGTTASGTMAPSGSLAGGLQLPSNSRPHQPNWASAPMIPGSKGPKPSLGARRGLKLPGGLPGTSSPVASNPASGLNDSSGGQAKASAEKGDSSSSNQSDAGSLFNKFSNFVDTKTGSLKFDGKAVIHGKGIDFSSGSSFNISLDEVDTLEELGKGNYGTVYKVRHSRPQVRRPGLGLKGNKGPIPPANSAPPSAVEVSEASPDSKTQSPEQSSPLAPKGSTTGIIMAMKEIRLELDESKFAAIIMELDILHRCTSPFIVDFYGAFFQEGAVYICMEFMDGGSIDKLYGDGIPEAVLRKVTLSTVMGLKSLKEDHNIIHRDVKPTNILANTRGQVKICDFGVSGNLVASIAKTNIGCQSYMAPERIATGGVAQAGAAGGTYSVQSDVWSLGLSVVECAMGRYPYPPETYNNIFSQLNAIVEGEPPTLPSDRYSKEAQDFVKACLHKAPNMRPTYAMLLRHPWLTELLRPPSAAESPVDPALAISESDEPDTADPEVAAWAMDAIEKRKSGKMGRKEKPALHAAPLDAVSSPSLDGKELTHE